MKTKLILTMLILISWNSIIASSQVKKHEVRSLDGNISVTVETGEQIRWSVHYKDRVVLDPSSIALQLESGDWLGRDAKVKSVVIKPVDEQFNAINYRRRVIKDQYNQLTIQFKDDFSLVFRVFNDAVAYRFVTAKKETLFVGNEEANFNFTADHKAFIPIQQDYRDGRNFNTSFEALYREISLSKFPKDSLAFLPVLVDAGNNLKLLILEADLENYPGMYLAQNSTGKGFKGVYAPYPVETYVKGHNVIPSVRAPYIAKTAGTRNFPWRVVVIVTQDKELLNCDIVQKLASPSRVEDVSWIKPGLVAWDWWNNMNLAHVDFKAGMNTPTMKYYIDFASENKVPYVLIDAGWTNEQDLTVSIPEVNLKEIIDYGKNKNVGVIVWASWRAVLGQMGKAFPYLAQLGVKGLKIDFFDRDDQVAVASTYEIAKLAAENKLMVDFHGIFKPTGLQRTYPNVVGYEGVRGLEYYKWENEDQPRYCVTIPFIRGVAGPMDYTPGAMRNATNSTFFANNSMPMSKGTRCHQMAMYVVYEVPVQMLSDSPTAYKKEQECTDFLVKVPTVFDETVPLDGKVGEYVTIARQKDGVWYVGAMTNWNSRELLIDFSFLGDGNYLAEVFRDGINANRNANDYKKEFVQVTSADKLKINLMNGGGWVARITKKDNSAGFVSENVSFAEKQYKLHTQLIEESGQVLNPKTFVNGKIRYIKPEEWTSGFFPGSMWYLYELTGNPTWKELGIKYTEALDTVKYLTYHHDVGFMIGSSYGNALRLSGNNAYKEVIVQAAKSLSTRFRPVAGIIQSWNVERGWQSERGWECPVIIDNMMNLELLFEATRLSGDSSFYRIAVTHADKTIEHHFRPDYSTWHVIDYSMTDGKVRNKHTAQGYSHGSTWSRGQAWAIYGYVVCYRETKNPKYLKQAENAFKFVANHPNLPEDGVPYWDYNAPDIPNALRDASAAAIMASALYELSTYSKPEYYKGWADKIMTSLSGPAYRAHLGENGNFLLKHCVGSIPHNSEIDVPLNYADYYFLEALTRINSN